MPRDRNGVASVAVKTHRIGLYTHGIQLTQSGNRTRFYRNLKRLAL